jgi:hypothetical protein
MVDFSVINNEEQYASELALLRSLYPALTNDQLLEAKERLDGYFQVVFETFLDRYSECDIDDDLRAL